MLTKEDIYRAIVWIHMDTITAEDIRREYEECVARRDATAVKGWLCGIPVNNTSIEWYSAALDEAKKKREELINEWCFDIEPLVWGNSITLVYNKIKSFDEFVDWRGNTHTSTFGLNTWQNRIKTITKEWLWIDPHHWWVRLIYIKLFLEWKITEEDLKLLIQCKDVDIQNDILEMVPEWTEPIVITNEDDTLRLKNSENWFVFINN